MSNKKLKNNDIKETGIEGEGFFSGKNLMGKQHESSRHLLTVHRKWSKEDNKMAIVC